MIYCIGDSHVSFFSGSDKMIRTYPFVGRSKYFTCARLSPMTAHNSMNYAEVILLVSSKINVRSSDYVLLPLGETDCRAEFFPIKQLVGDGIHNAISETVDRYVKTILYLGNTRNILVWGVHGAGKSPGYGKGSQEERNIIIREFNEKLSTLCDENNIPFICIFDDMVDGNITKDGWLDADNIHLGQTSMPFVIEKFKELGLIK